MCLYPLVWLRIHNANIIRFIKLEVKNPHHSILLHCTALKVFDGARLRKGTRVALGRIVTGGGKFDGIGLNNHIKLDDRIDENEAIPRSLRSIETTRGYCSISGR